MLNTRNTGWMRLATLVLFGSLAMTACSDDPVEPEEEPEIASIVVTVGSSTVTIPASGSQTPGPLQVTANASNAISIQFRNDAGADEPVIAEHRDEFEVRLTVGTSVITLTAGTGATFTGNITPPVTGPAAYTLVLYNTEHGHAEVSKVLSVSGN